MWSCGLGRRGRVARNVTEHLLKSRAEGYVLDEGTLRSMAR